MYILQQYLQNLREEQEYLDDLYIEVPDPDNSEETILVYKGFEDIIYDEP